MVSLSLDRSASIVDGSPVITLTVTESLNVDTNVFKHKVSDRGEANDYYVAVCSVRELSELGVVRSGGPTYYRKNTATIRYESMEEAVRGKTDIEEELQLLLNNYDLYVSGFVGEDSLNLESNNG